MINLATVPLPELPVRFTRVTAGEYRSKCGLFRIHLTTHKGHLVSHSGARRWHITHNPTGRTIGHRGARHPYELRFDEAVRTLHLLIGRALNDGLGVLATMNAEAERAATAATAARTARAELVQKIFGVLNRWSSTHPIEILQHIAHDIADTIQGESK